MADPDDTAEAAPDRGGADVPARARLVRALAPRATTRQAVVGLLFVALGFGAVAATRAQSQNGLLATAREDEVVRVLDDLTERATRLQAEQRALEAARDRLQSGSEAQRLAASRARADALAVLAGTVAVSGPGIRVTIEDGGSPIPSTVLLDAVQELRDAGAEAIQIGGVRVVASTWFADAASARGAAGGISVGGTVVGSPYRLLVIGDPTTLATALQIPGGVADTVRTAGGRITVTPATTVDVTALQPLSTPEYARPAPSPSGS